MRKVSASVPKMDRTVEINYDFGANIDEACAKFGKEVCFYTFLRGGINAVQAVIRTLIQKDRSDSEIQEFFKSWKLGKTQAVEQLMWRWSGVSEEDRVEFILREFDNMSSVKQEKVVKALLKQRRK